MFDETNLQTNVSPNDYDVIIVAFSGGKDSLACILHLLEMGIPKTKIELWHHLIDGNPGVHFMDWFVTKSYVQAVAKALELPLYFSWREEGFEGELLRHESRSHNVRFETPNGLETYIVKKGTFSTREKFPMLHSRDLNKRWCTSICKIDCGRLAISHQDRFLNKKILFISGERAEESLARAGYNIFEIHKMDNRNGKNRKRWVDAWRPVHQWSTAQVWAIIQKWKINPHPCYSLGWGRCSCEFCIFSSSSQVATLFQVDPEGCNKILQYEHQFQRPIHCNKGKNKEIIPCYYNDFAHTGRTLSFTEEQKQKVMSTEFTDPIFLEEWIPPSGIKGDMNGSI
jgi:3'-phosphoadenosine 5'-phosphosulfate sulfotransferase (PAPS reductase)/FAD synthetase